jgi:hypothetical protein
MESIGPKPAGTSRQPKLVTDRRHSVRLRVHSPAYASLNGSSPEQARDLSEILDIGEEGMSIQTSSPLEVDHDLNLSLDLSETKARISTTGRVVWSDHSGRAGIRFPELPGQSLRQLKEWLFVNVLTAFDHAGSRMTPAYAEASNGGSNPHFFRQDTSQNKLSSESSRLPGDGGSQAALKAVQRKVESGVYDREAALQVIAEQAQAFTRAAGAAIALSQNNAMICVARAGSDAPPLGAPFQVGSGFSGECVRTGRSLRCDDSETDDRVDRQSCRVLGIRSIVAVPIRRGNGVAGLLEVFAAQPYAFNSQDISLLQELTGTILSAATGGGVEALAAPHDLPKESAVKVQPPRIEERLSAEVMADTRAAAEGSPRPHLHKILLAVAVITFLFVVVWLIAPWASSRVSLAGSSSHLQEPQTASSRPPGLPADVTDLAGLRKLAEQGDPAAQFSLGARYATGEEVKQDYTEAVRWFALAADRGHILAQATLGAYYWAGRGVTPDLTRAYFWSALAQAGGDQASKYRVEVLASRMSRSEILAAQQQANDWLRNHQMSGKVPSSH